ncbi:MAG: neutral/alkaline non-lysosomal ceramidase N-terminal domain-containing protein [Planctomycetota bacterium]|nr:neutral/alkaline non-lysosomal ceramidase N-terminal domain-containing protein [Planctomycetota bacterium]
MLTLLILLGSTAAPIQVGVARVEITPTEPLLLAGYGSRRAEFTSVDSPLHARALAIGEVAPLVLLAIDNAGVPATVVDEVSARVERLHGIPAERLVVASTHTHSAPTLTGYAPILWAGRTSAEQREATQRYTDQLTDTLVSLTTRALDARAPATLTWGQGRVEIASNRRVLDGNGDWRGFGHQTDGPVDHSLPALVARDAEGEVFALWFGYACHCTTLGDRNTICGDWAGYACGELEADGDVVALCTIGCGADQGPQPSGSLALAREHGASIAHEVRRLAASELTTLQRAPVARSQQVDLPLVQPPGRAYWAARSVEDGFEAELARSLSGKPMPTSVPLPITTWTFGDELGVVFLGGEVVVDYAVRLKREADWTRLWVNAYCDGVPCYVPSRRVLAEGGYEAEFSQVYYGWPAPFDPAVEDLIHGTIGRLLGPGFAIRPDTPEPSFLAYPSAADLWARRLPRWAADLTGEDRAWLAERFARNALPGCARIATNEGERSEWYDYAGGLRERAALRQSERGRRLVWATAPLAHGDRTAVVFAGGLGYESQPATRGYSLVLNGAAVLTFDLTRSRTTWTSLDGGIALHYLPTWTAPEDTGGLFWLEVREGFWRGPGQRTIEVRSLGEGSRRWFALDDTVDASAVEQQLRDALR